MASRKVRWLLVPIACIFSLGVGTGVLAASGTRKLLEVEYRWIRMEVDGTEVKTESEPFVVVNQGRTFVPARALAESLGAKVVWDDATQTVKLYRPGYMESAKDNGLTTWTHPYTGLRLQTPAEMDRIPDDTFLLLTGTYDGMQLFGLLRADDTSPQTDLSSYYATMSQTITAKWGTGHLVSKQQRTVAGMETTAITTEYETELDPVMVELTLVRRGGNIWTFAAMGRKSTWQQAQPSLEKIYRSVTLPS